MKIASPKALSLGFLLFGLVLGALPLLAHHSFAAEYDDTKPVKFAGRSNEGGMDESAHLVLRRRKESGWHSDRIGRFLAALPVS